MMDAPVLTAVISVSGTLLGAIVGGCLTMYSNFFLNKRRERAEFRMSCRLIAGELEENQIFLKALLETPRFWKYNELATEAWKEHRHVLATYLPSEAWSSVEWAVQVVRRAREIMVTNDEETSSEETIAAATKELREAPEFIATGRASLQPYIQKTKARTIGSTRPRAGCPRTTRAGRTR
jgi:hypothetical protein